MFYKSSSADIFICMINNNKQNSTKEDNEYQII